MEGRDLAMPDSLRGEGGCNWTGFFAIAGLAFITGRSRESWSFVIG